MEQQGSICRANSTASPAISFTGYTYIVNIDDDILNNFFANLGPSALTYEKEPEKVNV